MTLDQFNSLFPWLQNQGSLLTYFTVYFPLFLSGLTAVQTFLAGDKHRLTWSLAMVSQVFWFLWIAASGSWGFLPLNAIMAYMSYKNHRKWKADKARLVQLFETKSGHPLGFRLDAVEAPEPDHGNGWVKIDKDCTKAPWGEICVLVNADAGMETVHILRRSEEFYTHYLPYRRFSKRDQNV